MRVRIHDFRSNFDLDLYNTHLEISRILKSSTVGSLVALAMVIEFTRREEIFDPISLDNRYGIPLLLSISWRSKSSFRSKLYAIQRFCMNMKRSERLSSNTCFFFLLISFDSI